MSSVTKLQERVRDAVASAETLRIVGGNSKRDTGREPLGEPVSTSELAGVVEYQPTELMITARAGTTIADLEAILAEQDQVLASESPGYEGRATIGGTLACSASGPSRPWRGSIRDHVLGVRLVNGRAEHLRFGGQVMKNVAGYDVSRLQAGAMGCFGVLTEVSLKVLPKPESSISVRRETGEDDAIRLMNEISMTPAPLTGAFWWRGSMYLRLSGPDGVVNAEATRLGGDVLGEGAEVWSDLREQVLPLFDGDEALWQFSIRPNAPRLLEGEEWLIDWGGARRWLRGQHDRDELDAIAAEAGGEVTLVRGPDRTVEMLPSVAGPKRDLLMRVKQAFDPAGVFNPGRLYSWM